MRLMKFLEKIAHFESFFKIIVLPNILKRKVKLDECSHRRRYHLKNTLGSISQVKRAIKEMREHSMQTH
jgi:hypothetical protein